MAKRWQYFGDVNLEHGGTFYDFSDWKHGYVSAVEVIDLDSACGFTGALLVEEQTIITDQKPERLQGALSCIGATLLPNGDIADNGQLVKRGTARHRWVIAYACQSYGYKDVGRSEFVQPEPDGPLTFQSWTATRIRSNGLRAYVRKQFLDYRR